MGFVDHASLREDDLVQVQRDSLRRIHFLVRATPLAGAKCNASVMHALVELGLAAYLTWLKFLQVFADTVV